MAGISIISKIVSRGNGKTITAGKPYSSSGNSVDLSSKLDKTIWDAVFYTDENGNLRVKTNLLGEMGISGYKTGEGTNLPSIYDGMPIDNITLYWDNGVLKSKGTDGMDEGKLKNYLDSNAYINNANKANYLPSWALAANKPAYTWSEISNKPAWIGSDKPAYAWTEIGSKPSWIGVNKPSYAWSEIGGKPSWIGDNKPSYTFSEIGGKPTTLSGYGITDAVTLNTSQTITAAKNFTGGFAVNGCAIVYDTVNKAWKLTGNLLVTGGITAYGDILTGSAILDALPVDSTLSKEGGVLSVVGGGFLSSITVKLGAVAYDSANGIVSLPSYPTTLPASDVSAWAKAASKPAYTWSEIGGKPFTFAPSAHSHAISEITSLQGLLDGKAASGHTHNYASTVKVGATGYNVIGNVISLPEYPTALRSPNALTISLNGASQGTYDGSAAKSFNINYSNVGAPSTTGGGASGTWGIAITGNSASSAKLQTARSINGTNFDGTGNIVTSYWGTARNFSIVSSNGSGASSASSVNGSGNVSLYLPSTITASLSGNASTATALQTTRSIWGQNFNGSNNVSGTLTSVTGITMSGTLNNSGKSLLGVSYSQANVNAGPNFHVSTGDATLAIYGAVGQNSSYGTETACIQSSFDIQNPETSTFPATYPQRAILALQPRGGRVAIGKTTADYLLDVNGQSRFTSHLFAYSIIMNYGGSSWISMFQRNDAIRGNTKQTESAAHSLYWVESFSGHRVAFGGLGNDIGFYGIFKSTLDAGTNRIDWFTRWNTTNGDFTHSGTMRVGNQFEVTNSIKSNNGRFISSWNSSYTHTWSAFFNTSNAQFTADYNVLPQVNHARSILNWRDQLSGQGYITGYCIGSYRNNATWGSMVLAVSNSDSLNSMGAAINIAGNGTVTIEGNLLVTGAITQYSNGISSTDTFTSNVLRANNCLLVGSSTVQDAPERYICCYGKTGSSYICIGNAPSAGNTGEICYTHVGAGHLDNSISLGFYGGQQFGRLLLRARGNNFLDGSLTASGTITQGSDMRRKTVVRSITGLTTDQIANAPLFDYYWKDLNDGAHTGTSAQYWQNILPNTVRDNGINGLALDYNGVNIAGLITVSREIVKLKRENEELRQEINKLKERAA